MIRWNGLFIMNATFTPTGLSFVLDKTLKPHDISALITCKPSEVSVVDVQSHHRYMLLAAQMHVDASGLRRHAGASQTFDFKTVPTSAARVIDSDVIRIAANLRRTPTVQKAPALHRPTEIGHTFQLDGFGHVGTKAVVGNEMYQWLIIDAVSDFMYDALTCTSSLATLFDFLDIWLAAETALGHSPEVLIFDACPTWANDTKFTPLIAARYKCKAIVAAGATTTASPSWRLRKTR